MQTLTPMFGSGVKYSLPADKVDSFKQDFGDQAEDGVSLRTKDGQSYTIPRSKAEAFKADFPDAQEVRTFQMADGTTRQMTTSETMKFLRSKEYRESEDYAEQRKALEERMGSPTWAGVKGFVSGLAEGANAGGNAAANAMTKAVPEIGVGVERAFGNILNVGGKFRNPVGDWFVRDAEGAKSWLDTKLPSQAKAYTGYEDWSTKASDKVGEVAAMAYKFAPAMATGGTSVGAAAMDTIFATDGVNAASDTYQLAKANGYGDADAGKAAAASFLVNYYGGKAFTKAGMTGGMNPVLAFLGRGAEMGNIVGLQAAANKGIENLTAGEDGKPAPKPFMDGMWDAYTEGQFEGNLMHYMNAVPGAVMQGGAALQARRNEREMRKESLLTAAETAEGAQLLDTLLGGDKLDAAIAARAKGESVSRKVGKGLDLPDNMSAEERNAVVDAIADARKARARVEELKAQKAEEEKQSVAEERRAAEAKMEAERKAREAEEEATLQPQEVNIKVNEGPDAPKTVADNAPRTEEYPEYANWLKHKFRTDTDKNWNRFVAENGLDPALKVERGREAKPIETKAEEAQPVTDKALRHADITDSAKKTVAESFGSAKVVEEGDDFSVRSARMKVDGKDAEVRYVVDKKSGKLARIDINRDVGAVEESTPKPDGKGKMVSPKTIATKAEEVSQTTEVTKKPDGKGRMVKEEAASQTPIIATTSAAKKVLGKGKSGYSLEGTKESFENAVDSVRGEIESLKDDGKSVDFVTKDGKYHISITKGKVLDHETNKYVPAWHLDYTDRRNGFGGGGHAESDISEAIRWIKSAGAKVIDPNSTQTPHSASAPKKVESTATTAAKPAEPAKRVPDGKGRMKTESVSDNKITEEYPTVVDKSGKRRLTGIAAQRKAASDAEKAQRSRFANEELNGAGEFPKWNERGRLFSEPPFKTVRNANGRGTHKEYYGDPAAEAINHALDGLKGAEREKMEDLLFGKKGNRVSSSTVGNDTVYQNNDYERVISDFMRDYDRYREFVEKGGKTSEELAGEAAEAEARAREIKIGGDSYDIEDIEAHKRSDEIYNNAAVEVDKFDSSSPEVKNFSRDELRHIKKGDTIRFDHQETEWVADGEFDAKNGEIVVSMKDMADNPLFTEAEKAEMRGRRFRITENGWIELKEKKNGNQSKNGAAADDSFAGDAKGKQDGFVLEGGTAEELAAEQRRIADRKEIERRQNAPLKTGKGEVGQDLLDLGGAEGEDLFNRVNKQTDSVSSDSLKTAKKLLKERFYADEKTLMREMKALPAQADDLRAAYKTAISEAKKRNATPNDVTSDASNGGAYRGNLDQIADRTSMHRLDPKLRSEPAVLAWAKKRGRVVDNGMVTADARREYDREQAMGAAKLTRNWFPDMKVTYHDYGENVKRGQHVLDFRVGIRGAENANDIPAMRGYNVAEKMLKEKPWNQMSIEEKRKFNLATGYQVGADGMLKREVPDFALKGDFSDKIKSIDDSLSLVHKMMDEYDANEKSRKYGTPIFKEIRDYYLRDGNLRKFISGIRYPEVKEKLEPIADAIDSLEKNKAVVFSGKLVDVIDGDGAKLLKRYYPDIDKIRFSIQHSDEAGLMGWFDPNKNEIVMTQNGISRGFEDVYGTILHETQHFVQHKEGFGVGGSSSAKILNTFRGLDYIIRDPAALVSDIDNLINPPSDVYGIVLKDAIERKIAYMFPNVDIKDTGSLRSLSEKIKKSIPYIDYVKSKMEREGLKFTNDPYFDYKRLMGEVESRDVQYRMQHPENKGRLFEETEEFPSHEQIDNRSFSELLELASERRVDDGNIMRLRDRAGNTLGWFDPNSKEVHLLPGANAETVAHEIMWHGTRDWAKTEAAKGNRDAQRLLDKMHEVEKACPDALKKAILRTYRKNGVTDPDTLLNEFGAWDAMVNGGKALGKELQKRENAVWYARWWNAVKDLIKSYLARHGKNRVDFSGIDGMTTDEFKDFLAAQFAGGKTLGEIVPKAGKTVSTDETKFQKARRVVYDVNASIRDLERDIEKAHGVKIKFDESAEAANALTPGLREAELLATSATEREYREILDAGKLSNADVEAYMGAKAAAGRDTKVDAKNIAQIAKDVERDLRTEWGTDKIAKDTAAFDAELQNRVAAAQAAYNSTNGSHIDPREARTTVRETETGSHAADYANARAKLRAVMDETLQVQKDAGLISEELYNKLKTEEPDYVPFKNEYDVETGEAYGRGVNNFTKPEFYEARGRQSAAGDIVAHIFQDNLSAKHRAIENGVREKLARLVERFPELGTVEKIGEAWKEKQKSLSDRKDKANQTGDPNVVMFKRNGDTYAIRLNGERGAAIAAGITERNVMRFSDLLGDKVGDKLNKFSRFQAGLATRYAPFFAFRNLPKDNIELGNIVLSERGLLEGSRWIKDYVASYKDTAGALSKFVLTGKVDASTPGGQVLQRYIDAGGLISGGGTEGYDAQSIRTRMDPKFIEKEMKRGRSKTYATLQYAKRGLGYLSEMSELMTRVNAFNAELKSGKSDGEAALFSRRATVDFNRHGELTGVTNVLRLFSNSTLGATARATAALANSKGGRTMAAILFANGMARVALEHLMNDEDDKGREAAGTGTGKDVPEYERQTSLFYVRNGDNIFKIAEHESPFSLITYAGDTFARVIYGDISVGQAAKNLGISTAEVAFHLTGLGNINLTSREGGLESDSKAALVSLAPSLVQPAVEVITGIDYKGDPISMQLFDQADVRSHHPRANTPDYQVKTAQFLNWITGGNAGRRGYADLSPEAVGKLIEGYGKNALREGLMAYDLAKAMVGDKKWSDVDVGQKPLVRDWVRPIRGNTNRYYDAKRTRKEDRKDFDVNSATMSVEERYAYATAHPSAVGNRSEAMGKLETSIQRIQKMERGFVYKNGKAVPHEWSEDKVDEFEKRRLELQAKYLKLMETPGK